MSKYVGENSLSELVTKTKTLVASKQDALPTSTTAGKFLKSTSTAGTIQWGDGDITEITTQYVGFGSGTATTSRTYITQSGIYKLTYNGTKYIYYYGTSTSSTYRHTVTGGAGAVYLVVNMNGTSTFQWYYINGTTSYSTIYFGYTSNASTGGAVSSKALSSLLTSAVTSLNGSTGALTNFLQQSSTTTTANQVMISSTTANQGSWSGLKTINSNSLLGSGDITVGGIPTLSTNPTATELKNLADGIYYCPALASNSQTVNWDYDFDAGDIGMLIKQGTNIRLITTNDGNTKDIYVVFNSTFTTGNAYDLAPSYNAPKNSLSTNTTKAYLVGNTNGALLSTALYNTNCYMQSGKLYSNGNEVQEKLVSGTSIKTINNESLLGSGNISISSGTTYSAGTGMSLSGTTFSSPHTIRGVSVSYSSSSGTSANWSISVSLSAGEYISGFMWCPSPEGSYENNRVWQPNGAPTFSTTGIVSSATTATITVPIKRNASGGSCGIAGVVFITKVG